MEPSSQPKSENLDVALKAAEAACEIIRQHYGQQIERTNKVVSSQSLGLVTQADLDAEQAIIEIIRSHYPDHNFLAEEGHAQQSTEGQLWVIDPVDGTNNFAHGLPHFSVSIAYCEDGQTQCGVVANPVNGEICWAERGRGAWLGNRRVHVSSEKTLADTIAVTGFYYDRGAMIDATLATMRELFDLDIRGIRRFGSAALDLCYVGLGRFGVYFEYRLSPWDYAAGKLFVEEAGGLATSCAGKEIGLHPTSMLATNGHLHDAVLQVTRNRDNPKFYSS